MLPDFILHVGDAVVSKRLKQFLRSASEACTWRISLTGQVEDTFQNLRGLVVGDAESILQSLSMKMHKRQVAIRPEARAYRRQWLQLLRQAREQADAEVLPYGEAAAVRWFERQLGTVAYAYDVHYANSTAIRLANRYADGHPVWCNRGVNGIEGSLSTAVGFAAATAGMVFCVVGDLSFFYDQNALWNQRLRGNLRVLLLNNGRGAIFDALPGLEQSDARERLVGGAHVTTAEGICAQNHVDYRQAADMDGMQQGVAWLLQQEGNRPRLLEVRFHRA